MSKKLPRRALAVALSALFVLTVLLSLFAGLFQFDGGTNYYLRGAVLPVCAVVTALVGAVVAFVMAFGSDASPFPTVDRRAHLLPAAGTLSSGIVILWRATSLESTSRTLAILSGVLLLLSALFFALSAFLGAEKSRGGLALLGFACPLAAASLTFYYYFDKTVEMNSPVKVFLQLGLLFAIPAFLLCSRSLLDRSLPRLLSALSLAFLPLSALAAGPCAAMLAGITAMRVDYLVGALLILTLQALAVVRLFSDKEHI